MRFSKVILVLCLVGIGWCTGALFGLHQAVPAPAPVPGGRIVLEMPQGYDMPLPRSYSVEPIPKDGRLHPLYELEVREVSDWPAVPYRASRK